VLIDAESQDFQIYCSSSEDCVLAQTRSSDHTRLFLVVLAVNLSGEVNRQMFLRLLGLLSFESQIFLSQVFLDNLHRKVFPRFKNSSLGPERWRKTYKCHEDDEVLRKF